MINRIIRYLRGYLRICISGNAVERFINNCSYKGICLWNLTSCQSKYEMNISVKDFKKLKPVIRKTRTKVVIVNRAGFPFFLHRYRHRKLFFSGFFLCMIIIYLLSTHIWNISISGNKTYTEEALLEFLSSLEIKTGMKRSAVDCSEIVREIRQQYDDIIWVSASLKGSDLILQIKENEDSKTINEEPKIQDAFDIVASDNCQITKIIIRNGLANIKPGDYVKAGDLLVSGQIPIYNDAKEIINYQYCVSDADIYGKTTLNYEDEISSIYFQKNLYDIKKQEYFLCLGKYRFQLGSIRNDYEHFTEYSSQMNLAGISVGTRSAQPYEPVSQTYSKHEIQKKLSASFQHYCKELEKKGVVILKNDVKIYTWSDKAKATGTINVEMPIGQLEKSELIEIGEHIDGNDGNNN